MEGLEKPESRMGVDRTASSFPVGEVRWSRSTVEE